MSPAWRIRLVAYGARLESVLGASPRGFESPILRGEAPGSRLNQQSLARFRGFCRLAGSALALLRPCSEDVELAPWQIRIEAVLDQPA